MVELVAQLQAEGVPIDCIGIQAHLKAPDSLRWDVMLYRWGAGRYACTLRGACRTCTLCVCSCLDGKAGLLWLRRWVFRGLEVVVWR